jgi:glycosyltransferase involved in cell wall biosynthesis
MATSPLTLRLMPGHLQYLRQRGFDVAVASPAGRHLDELARMDGVQAIVVPMARVISPWKDLASLWRLWRVMRALRPTVSNVGTPKAGLLGGFAAWLAGVPCRVYTLRGLRFESTRGFIRSLLIFAERLACAFAHRVICVSPSLREKAIASRLTRREKTVVFGAGSSNGVDVEHFMPTPERLTRAAALRQALGIPAQAPVLGFVGRLTHDKGVPELAEAFWHLRMQFPELRLLLLGRFEAEDPLPSATRKCLETHPAVILPGYDRENPASQGATKQGEGWPVDDAAPYYALMDIFVLPSHREGLPNVVLEAQAAGRPVVAAAATGTVDAVLHGVTGLLFPVGDAGALAKAVATLLRDKALAARLARAGHQRVRHEFRQEQIWEALYQEYRTLMRAKNLPLPALRPTEGRGASPRVAVAPTR